MSAGINHRKHLLVPINVEALVIGEEHAERKDLRWSHLSPDFSRLYQGDILGGRLSPSLKSKQDNPHKSGVHLHWALPDALTHGYQSRPKGSEEANTPKFPYVPNRWMVQRLVEGKGNKIQVRAWIIESDYLFDEDGVNDDENKEQGITLPKLDSQRLYAYAGKRFDYGEWQEGDDPDYKFKFTAVGYGDPAFAAYYPACKSMLGFHDDLNDLEEVPEQAQLSYLVTGWYSDPQHDPLYVGEDNAPSTAEWLVRLEALKWRVEWSQYPLSKADANNRCLTISSYGDLTDAFSSGNEFQILRDSVEVGRLKITASRYAEPDFILEYEPSEAGDLLSFDPQSEFVIQTDLACPDRTLCHGFVCSIDREKGKQPNIPSLSPQNCQVAVGATSAEALAALLSEGREDTDSERLLTALQGGILGKEPDLKDVEALLHQGRFASIDGGHQISIRKDAPEDLTLDAQHEAASSTELLRSTANQEVGLSAEVQRRLDELNQAVQQQGQDECRFRDLRWELFSAWYKRVDQAIEEGKMLEVSNQQFDPVSASRIESLKAAIQREGDSLKKRGSDLNVGLDALTKVIRERLGVASGASIIAPWRTVETPLPPFWQAKEPVVMVSAEAARLSKRHGHDGSDSDKDELTCRISGQETIAIRVNILDRTFLVEGVDTFTFDRIGPMGGAVPMGITDALVWESLFLHPNQLDRIVEQAYVSAELSTQPGGQALIEDITTLQTLKEDGARSVAMLPSPIARCRWEKNPWLPLFMKWSLSWHSSFDELSSALSGWSLSDEVATDYRFSEEKPGSETALYKGYTMLTPHALDRFRETLTEYNEDHPDRELERMLPKLDDLNIVSQVLGGLGEAFRQRDAVLQIPPIRIPPETDNIFDPITALIGDATDTSPNTKQPFYPIRAGHAKLIKLEIVDAFGQTVAVPRECLEHPVRASGMRTKSTPAFIELPPRVVQPMRLRFDWAPADNLPGAPLSSPICGWVAPNYLDKSLLFFDGNGNALGALQKILRHSAAGGTGATPDPDLKAYFWVSPPGKELQPEAIHNPELRGFVQFLREMDADTGEAFWKFLDRSLCKMDSGVPVEDPLTSILVGRPLALTRLDLGLELSGLPAYDQSKDKIGQEETGGFERLKFPLWFGEANNDNDGLVGYFHHNAQSPTQLGPFYPAALPGQTDTNSKLAKPSSIEVDCTDPLSLVILMEPLARIHARTGLLPRTYGELPHRWRFAAKSVKTAFFQTAPIISPGGDLRLPKPSDDFGKWSWASRPRVRVWDKEDTLEPLGDRAGFPPTRQELREGWLKLRLNSVSIAKFSVVEARPERTTKGDITQWYMKVAAPATVTFQWLLKGGSSLTLSSLHGEEKKLEYEWKSLPFPEEFKLTVSTDTTFSLCLADDDNNRDECFLSTVFDSGDS
jgi:hypothetical protein